MSFGLQVFHGNNKTSVDSDGIQYRLHAQFTINFKNKTPREFISIGEVHSDTPPILAAQLPIGGLSPIGFFRNTLIIYEAIPTRNSSGNWTHFRVRWDHNVIAGSSDAFVNFRVYVKSEEESNGFGLQLTGRQTSSITSDTPFPVISRHFNGEDSVQFTAEGGRSTYVSDCVWYPLDKTFDVPSDSFFICSWIFVRDLGTVQSYRAKGCTTVYRNASGQYSAAAAIYPSPAGVSLPPMGSWRMAPLYFIAPDAIEIRL